MWQESINLLNPVLTLTDSTRTEHSRSLTPWYCTFLLRYFYFFNLTLLKILHFKAKVTLKAILPIAHNKKNNAVPAALGSKVKSKLIWDIAWINWNLLPASSFESVYATISWYNVTTFIIILSWLYCHLYAHFNNHIHKYLYTFLKLIHLNCNYFGRKGSNVSYVRVLECVLVTPGPLPLLAPPSLHASRSVIYTSAAFSNKAHLVAVSSLPQSIIAPLHSLLGVISIRSLVVSGWKALIHCTVWTAGLFCF